jgi:hypothetical protein
MAIPEHMQTAIDNWVEYGTPAPSEMGSFLRAVLSNDLRASVMFADEANRAAIVDWVEYLYMKVPSGAHGSAARLAEWHRLGGRVGRHPIEGAA